MLSCGEDIFFNENITIDERNHRFRTLSAKYLWWLREAPGVLSVYYNENETNFRR